jgi:fructose-specific phosphotransferase system IIC component
VVALSTTVQVLAVIVGLLLTAVWAMEIFFYRHPRLFFMFLIKPADYEPVRLWRVSIAYFNLTTAAALFIGAYLLSTSHSEAGQALILFTACQHIFMAVVMLITQPKLWLNSIMEATPNVVLLLAYALT